MQLQAGRMRIAAVSVVAALALLSGGQMLARGWAPAPGPGDVPAADVVGQADAAVPAEATLDSLAAGTGAAGPQGPVPVPVPVPAPVAAVAAAPDCRTRLALKADGPLLELSATLPCDAGEVVHIAHAGVRFSRPVAADGTLRVVFPALAAEALVNVTLPGEESPQLIETPVPGFDMRSVLGLAWTAGDPVAVNVFENGAAFGEPGHLRAARGVNGAGAVGRLFLLGDPGKAGTPLTAIYLVPKGGIDAAIELEVSSGKGRTCGRDVVTTRLGAGPDGDLERAVMRVTLPDCGEPAGWVLLPIARLEGPRLAEAENG
ncbi:hypothetical protein [Frigidibacter sp. MR17.24]|uniref:hypothetical protein n=1 Tax=Frigidibacter sp. MR17.24 TaxID=3127345 RepID=UPI003012C80A